MSEIISMDGDFQLAAPLTIFPAAVAEDGRQNSIWHPRPEWTEFESWPGSPAADTEAQIASDGVGMSGGSVLYDYAYNSPSWFNIRTEWSPCGLSGQSIQALQTGVYLIQVAVWAYLGPEITPGPPDGPYDFSGLTEVQTTLRFGGPTPSAADWSYSTRWRNLQTMYYTLNYTQPGGSSQTGEGMPNVQCLGYAQKGDLLYVNVIPYGKDLRINHQVSVLYMGIITS